jgi:anti-sigma28 factor (negative regulator of flagellin synthesis)
VDLSGLASQIAQAHADNMQAQAARVGELSQVCAKGRYDVDVRQLSHVMVGDWLRGAGSVVRMEP